MSGCSLAPRGQRAPGSRRIAPSGGICFRSSASGCLMAEPAFPEDPSSAVDASPHPVDVVVGTKIRQRRQRLQLDQDTLARRVGVSFQQIQKYERGTNRVSASRLYDIAQALGVGVGYFFQDLERGDVTKNPWLLDHLQAMTESAPSAADPLLHHDSLELAASYWALPTDRMRATFADLLKAATGLEE